MINLENKNIILTGATGGIGASIADTLINLKSNLIVTGTNEKKLEELKHKHPKIISLIDFPFEILTIKVPTAGAKAKYHAQ